MSDEPFYRRQQVLRHWVEQQRQEHLEAIRRVVKTWDEQPPRTMSGLAVRTYYGEQARLEEEWKRVRMVIHEGWL